MAIDQIEVIEHNGMVGLLCRRCPTVLLTARDLDGSQAGLTLVELVEQAEEHESEKHGGTRLAEEPDHA